MGLRDRFPRRPSIPEPTARVMGLSRGERVLASADLEDDTVAAATPHRLLVADERALHLDVPWHEVDSAVWDPGARAVVLQLVDGRHLRLGMAGDARTLLPEVVRERVQSSVVVTTKVEVRGRRGVRVVVRRSPEGLLTQAIPDAGIRLDDPSVAEQVAHARRELATAVGLEDEGAG